jgi:hypothetical protein
MPAHGTQIAPAASLAAMIEPTGSNVAQTNLFKDVLAGLEGLETPDQENVSGDQTAGFPDGANQDGTAKQDGSSKKPLPDFAAMLRHGGLQPGPQAPPQNLPHVLPLAQFSTNQGLAQPVVKTVGPTEETADGLATQSTDQATQTASAADGSQTPVGAKSSLPAGLLSSVLPGLPRSATKEAAPAEALQLPSTAANVTAQDSDVVKADAVKPARPSLPAVEESTVSSGVVSSVAPSTTNTETNQSSGKASSARVESTGKSAATRQQPALRTATATTKGSATAKLQTQEPQPAEVESNDRQAAVTPTSNAPIADKQISNTPKADIQTPSLTAPLSQTVVAQTTPPPAVATVTSRSIAKAATREVSAPRVAFDRTARKSVAQPTTNDLPEANLVPADETATVTPVAPQATAPLPDATKQIQETSQPAPVEKMPVAPVPLATEDVRAISTPAVNPKVSNSRRSIAADSAPVPTDTAKASKQNDKDTDNGAPQPAMAVQPPSVPATQSAPTVPDAPRPSVAQHGHAVESIMATAEPKAQMAVRADNVAFAVRMLPVEAAPVHDPIAPAKAAASLPEPPVSQSRVEANQSRLAPAPAAAQSSHDQGSNDDSKHDTPSPAPAAARTETRDSRATDQQQPGQPPQIGTRWTEVSALRPADFGAETSSPEFSETAHANTTLAAQEAHVMAPEVPKAPSSGEILLHLTGSDQSPAAIRVAERAGSVNVSVHASDPVLRESLRSNLGELSNQLNQQGWKADVVKPAVMAAQAESQQDSHRGGQGSSQQQQNFGGDRQPQRDRRTPGQWQQELEQQISGGDARPGGKA